MGEARYTGGVTGGAMSQLALTRASTLGPVADQLRRGGGSVTRVFHAADLPLELVQRPAALIPLRDHFKIVEYAARELGDDALPARLALAAGVAGLGALGSSFLNAATLGQAIARSNSQVSSILQSGTRLRLTVNKGLACWSYEVLESQVLGRQKNEILALGYMIELVRHFTGRSWIPGRVDVPGGRLPSRPCIETLFQCDIVRGDRLSLTFPCDLLEIPGAQFRARTAGGLDTTLPDWQDLHGSVRELIRLGLLSKRPSRAWVATHLGLSVRTMQRRLGRHQTNFGQMLRETIVDVARELLQRHKTITEIAFQLGYGDPAHLTRAFHRALGVSPRDWRRLNVRQRRNDHSP
jgi:AraC-like DNA-binding protein